MDRLDPDRLTEVASERADGRTADTPVDFSHGDIAAFPPMPGALDGFLWGIQQGGRQAFTDARGDGEMRDGLAARLATFTGSPVSGKDELLIAPGSQGALFLAICSTASARDKVAIVKPDYPYNEKVVRFREAQVLPVRLAFLDGAGRAGIDLGDLEGAFRSGAKVFVFSNPNNPTGAIYAREEIEAIGVLAERYGVTVIVDQLYSRLLFAGSSFNHLRSTGLDPKRVVTIMGPSKTESLAGYRLGVAFGSREIVGRMGEIQSLVCLRAAGYNQAALDNWLAEPEGWLEDRIRLHSTIRDDLLEKLRAVRSLVVRTPDAGAFMFPRLPELSVGSADFVRRLRDEAKVVVTPGAAFGEGWDEHVRLNFSQDRASAMSAADRMAELLNRHSR